MEDIDARMKATRDEIDRLEKEIRERAQLGLSALSLPQGLANRRPCWCGRWGCIHPYIEREDEDE